MVSETLNRASAWEVLAKKHALATNVLCESILIYKRNGYLQRSYSGCDEMIAPCPRQCSIV